jgi:hypothetical protein
MPGSRRKNVSNASFARIMYGSNKFNEHSSQRGLLPFAPAVAATAENEMAASPKMAHGSLEELLHRAWAALSHKS